MSMKEHLRNIVKNLMAEGNSSTILICGRAGQEKSALLQEIVKGILGANGTKGLELNPNVFGIWEANLDTATIGIDLVHEFIRKAQLKPFSHQYKVGIIEEAQRLTLEAQNALLKTLEEPPRNTFLILTAGRPSELIPTIISRCKILGLQENKVKYAENQDIKHLLSASILVRFQFIDNLLKEKNKSELSKQINSLLEELLIFYRDSLIKDKSNEDNLSILKAIELIETTQYALERNVITRLALENLFINLPPTRLQRYASPQ